VNRANDAGFVGTCLTVQEATLLYWTPTRSARNGSTVGTTGGTIAATVGAGGGQMRNIFWQWVLATNGGNAAFGGFAGFGEGVVAGVEVFTLLVIVRTRYD